MMLPVDSHIHMHPYDMSQLLVGCCTDCCHWAQRWLNC